MERVKIKFTILLIRFGLKMCKLQKYLDAHSGNFESFKRVCKVENSFNNKLGQYLMADLALKTKKILNA